ncbi:lysine transporter LysE [Deinococcus cellulosilyticus NBRC 106333 = KACC 11606]|uniref:Lysine transporter LysE n=1 Tax=Deinococcus cellulosilyticus (strain DSM 18568 / NBRC 106333 / KACC 11606 / 5516J-15) TaxID=1223518 RepID=A0A511N0P9_DEIC1|nr:lysine transporter LysE [Deinococcus cellulosilyticus NBRC 106333 = KACC 11606]
MFSGLLVGFAIAMPVGAIGTLCFTRTLSQGFWVGFLSGLGAATADALYGALVAYGGSLLGSFVSQWELPLKVVGSLFLVYLAATTWSSPLPRENLRLQGAYFSTLLLTLSNPSTLLSFAAVLTAQGLTGKSSTALLFVLGCFLGSALWWLILATLGHLLSHRMKPAHLHITRKISGVMLLGFAAVGLSSAAGLLS